jgi:BirA family biotin operon repressor/biotin-[acetyl-CoA-carboxylase] ligase
VPGDRRPGGTGEHSTTQATRAPGSAFSWRPFLSPERIEEISSTNSELAARGAAGAPEGTVLLAERQLAGRGRLGRRWLDHPGGSVLCSILFRPAWAIDRWHLAATVVALSAIEAIEAETDVACCCKWPNDLLAVANGRKIAGILSEAGPGDGLVVGIGINCNWPSDFPPSDSPEAAEMAARATSLDRMAGHPVDRDRIADRMLEAVARRWAALGGRDGTPSAAAAATLGREYRSRCTTIGQLVRVELASEQVSGTALDVDDDGRLLVDVGVCIRTIDTGDVVHLRPSAAGEAD